MIILIVDLDKQKALLLDENENPIRYEHATKQEKDYIAKASLFLADLPSNSQPAAISERYHTEGVSDKVLKWLTFFVGCIVAIIYYFQLNISRKQWVDYKSSYETDQRAWVMPSQYIADFSADGSVTFKISYKNTGKTPALNVTHWASAVPGIGDDALDKKFKTPENFVPNNQEMLAPNADATIGTQAVNKSVVDAVRQGTSLYVFGVIGYDDVFRHHHWSQFCVKTMPDWKSNVPVPERNICDDSDGDARR